MNNEQDLSALLGEIEENISRELHDQKEESTGSQKQNQSDLEAIGRHICFNLAENQFAIPLSSVLEIGELQVVQPLPFLPSWLEGVTNIRGEIISVVNLSELLELSNSSLVRDQTFIIIHDENIKTAITVDSISGTRLLYRKIGSDNKKDASEFNTIKFTGDSAIFVNEYVENIIDLLQVNDILSTIRFH